MWLHVGSTIPRGTGTQLSLVQKYNYTGTGTHPIERVECHWRYLLYVEEGQSHDKTVSTIDSVSDPDSYRYLYEREKINTKYIISYVNVIHLNIFNILIIIY